MPQVEELLYYPVIIITTTTTTIIIIITATIIIIIIIIIPSTTTRSLRKNFDTVPGKNSIDSLKKTIIHGTSHIIWKVLQYEV